MPNLTSSSQQVMPGAHQRETPSSEAGSASQSSEESKRNVADSSDARTAQFTLISILLGIVLAALLDGLPRGASSFAVSMFASEPGMLIRVLAVVLMAVLLWLEYTWGVLTRFVFATPAHNLTYFVLAIVAGGTALSVADFRAWMGWITALAFAAVLSGIVNRPKFPEGGERKAAYDKCLKRWDLCELGAYILVSIVSAGVTLLNYAHTPWMLPNEAELWCSAGILAVVVADLAMQVVVYIPRLRKFPTPEADDSQDKTTVSAR